MIRSRFWIAGLAAASLTAGAACHSTPPPAPAARAALAPTPARTTPPPPPPARPATTRAAEPAPTPTEDELFRRLTLDQLNSQRPLGDAFFDYDQTSLREDARAALATDAAWLKRWPGTSIRIEGHADERGTAEYNLALGQSRARAVEDYLVSLGISADRIRVNSLGKDAPFCTGDTEACWFQNRRGHFVITAK